MILVAAAALWMAVMRLPWNHFQRVWTMFGQAPAWQSYVRLVNYGFAISLCMLSLAYLVVRWIAPRPPRSDVLRQPGMLLIGTMAGLVLVLMVLSALVPLVGWTNVPISLALAISWFAACRRYRSRAESGWIEILGRFLGVGWVVTLAATYPLELLGP